jgi:hypothetical protein
MVDLLDLAVIAEPTFEEAQGKVPEDVKKINLKKYWSGMMDLQQRVK